MSNSTIDVFPSDINNMLYNLGYFTAPAAKKHHSNYSGGLFEHSKCVAGYLRQWTDAGLLQWSRPESPEIVGYLHDLCKTDDYVMSPGEMIYRNPKSIMPGHGAKSVALASTIMRLNADEMLCIRYHMGAYEKDEWDEYGRAVEHCPNVAWTHLADMLASHCDGK